jgi:putative transposase
MAVGILDVGIYFPDQFSHAAKRSPAKSSLRDAIEPNLHLIEPGSIGRSEVYVEPGRVANQRLTRALIVVTPETVARWHRAGFRLYWKVISKARRPMGRKQTPQEVEWQRWVESCRRDLLDHVIAVNERHLKRLLSEYVRYYHADRTQLGLEKETPGGRVRCRFSGRVISQSRLGGLHHRYVRAA